MVCACSKKRIKETMKKMLIYLIIICALLVVSSVLLDIGYTASFKNDIPRNKVQLVANLKDRHIDFVFLGSSRVENHIDCDLITKLTGKTCINLGLQGSRINDGKALAQLLRTNSVTYNKLLMQVDYIYNFHNYSPSFISSIIPYVNNENFPKYLKEDLNLPLSYNLPFVRYAHNDKLAGLREVILQYAGKKPTINFKNGFNPLEGIGKVISGEFPVEIDASNVDLDRLLAIDDNIVLFTAPYCKNTINRDEFLGELTTRYPRLRNFVNIFDDQEDYYSNCGHLNKEGAARFTEIITNDILKN